MKLLGDNSVGTMKPTIDLVMGAKGKLRLILRTDNDEANQLIRSELKQRVWREVKQRVWREALMMGVLWCLSSDFLTWSVSYDQITPEIIELHQ